MLNWLNKIIYYGNQIFYCDNQIFYCENLIFYYDNQIFYEADAKRFGAALMDALQDVPNEEEEGENLLQMLSGESKKKNLKRIAQMALDGAITIGPAEGT